jgi:integrase
MGRRFVINQKNLSQFVCVPGRKDTLFFVDGERGLALRCTVAGGQSWIFQYVSPVTGHDRRLALGKVDAVSVATAKARAQELRGMVASKRCPYLEERKRDSEKISSRLLTVEKALEVHSERLRQHIKRHKEQIQILKRGLQPFIGRPIADIERREWVEHFEEIARTTPAAANKCQSAISAMYSDLLDRGLIDTHPLLRLKKRAKHVPRDRVASLEELKKCWSFVHSQAPCRTTSQFKGIVALIILTGCRRAEIGGMTWSEIDFERQIFSLPASRSKTKTGRVIPLCDAALVTLRRQSRMPEGDHVFSSSSKGIKAFNSFAKAWCLFKKEAEISSDLNLHDLRRTFSTYADEYLNIPIPVIEEFLGHRSGARAGIVGVYNRADYLERMKNLARDYEQFLQNLSASAATQALAQL